MRGVSRGIRYDKRKDKHYLFFSAFWVHKGQSKNRTFQVGNINTITQNDETHAFKTAVCFRRLYEQSSDNNTVFNSAIFQNWKQAKIYELIQFNEGEPL